MSSEFQREKRRRVGGETTQGRMAKTSQNLAQNTCAESPSCVQLCDPMDCSPLGSFVHGDFLGKNIGMGCHALLQGIFPTKGSNPGLPHCRQISLPSEPPGKHEYINIPNFKFSCILLVSNMIRVHDFFFPVLLRYH